MEIEEFTTEEVTADCGEVANVEDVRGLVEQLGLGGQQKFFATDKVATTFPYRKMTEQERVVYESLCPQRTDLAGYGDGVIPLRVLQISVHAKGLEFFKNLEVWHPRNGDITVPVLVGIKTFRQQNQNWDTTEQYILARWGTVLKPFSELIEEARVKYEAQLRVKFVKLKEKVESQLRTVEEVVRNYVLGNGGNINPSFYS